MHRRSEAHRLAEERRLAEVEALVRDEAAQETAHRNRFGPLIITGPDGVDVLLVVRPHGQAVFRITPPSMSGPYGSEWPNWRGSGLGVLIGLWKWLFQRTGFVLRIRARGLERRYRRHRGPDEHSVATLLAQASSAVASGGVPMLRWWASHRRP